MTNTTKEIQARHDAVVSDGNLWKGDGKKAHKDRGILLERLAATEDTIDDQIIVICDLEQDLLDANTLHRKSERLSKATIKAIESVTQYGINLKCGAVVVTHDAEGGWVKLPEIKALLKENTHEQD